MKTQSEIANLIETMSVSIPNIEVENLDEIKTFISETQLPSGAFANRGGHADLYYTFFGYLLCQALSMNEELEKLKKYIHSYHVSRQTALVEQAIYGLLQYAFDFRFTTKLKASVRMVTQCFGKANRTHGVYRYFMMLISFNYFWGWSGCISGVIFRKISTFINNETSPCSHVAAKLLMQHRINESTEKTIEQLLQYASTNGGFAAFHDNYNADMLSTAVALYALNQVGFDLRVVAPSCLDFINSHFEKGAFLSGDGDATRDLEYTFYGLLALGSLIQKKGNTKN